MNIRSIDSKEEWENFVGAISPHTFLQSWQWGEFNERMGNKIWRVGIFDRGTLLGVSLIIKVEARRGSFIFCPHGPIVSKFEIFETFFRYLTALGGNEKVSFVRISPLLPVSDDNISIFKNFGFRDAPLHMMHPERAWILDITPSEETLLRNMRKQTRHCILNAEKAGVEIVASNSPSDVNLFYSLYESTGDRQHFVPFSRSYLANEFGVFAKEGKSLVFFGKYRGETISGAMIIFAHGSAFYHHGASLATYPKIPVSHLLQWEAIREAKRRGCGWYNFWGIASSTKPDHPWAGLTVFKTGFGGVSEEYLHAQDFVLNSRYWFTYLVEKLRTMKRNY